MVQFTTESSDKKFNASVYAVDSKVDSDTRTISIRARCENPGRLLAPGMFARLNLITRVSNHSLLVPYCFRCSLIVSCEALLAKSTASTESQTYLV